MWVSILGRCRVDSRTKDLAKRILPHEIAIIDHIDMDEVAAEALVKKRIKALINASPSLSGRYPAMGPSRLLAAGIPIIEAVGSEIINLITEGSVVSVIGDQVHCCNRVFQGYKLEKEELEFHLEGAEKNLSQQLEPFALNTIDYATKEMKLIFSPLPLPKFRTLFKNRHVLVVVRGQDYKADLLAIGPYIKEAKPVLVGVDGGADALLEGGYQPDLIIGDMDSISDRALKCGAEIIVHAYPDGTAPGEKRIKELGLTYQVLPAPGTSEDAALLVAFESGADLIVAVGSHSNLIDFLNKGRKGMASTFLVRLKVGSILIDAKGVNKLYRQKMRGSYLAKLVIAALLPFIIIAVIYPNTYQVMRLLWMRIRILLGF